MKNSTRIELERKAEKLSRKSTQLEEITEKIRRLQEIREDLKSSLPDDIIEYLNYGLKVQHRGKPYTEERLLKSKDYNESIMEEKKQIFQKLSGRTIEELIQYSNKLQGFNYSSEKKLIKLEEVLEQIRNLNSNSQNPIESEGPEGFSSTNLFKD